MHMNKKERTRDVEKSDALVRKLFADMSLSVRNDVGLFDGGAEGRGGGTEVLALGAGDLGLPGAGDFGRPGGTGDFDWPATAGDGDLGLPGPGDLGRGGLAAPPTGCNAGALNEPMPNGSSVCNSLTTTTANSVQHSYACMRWSCELLCWQQPRNHEIYKEN